MCDHDVTSGPFVEQRFMHDTVAPSGAGPLPADIRNWLSTAIWYCKPTTGPGGAFVAWAPQILEAGLGVGVLGGLKVCVQDPSSPRRHWLSYFRRDSNAVASFPKTGSPRSASTISRPRAPPTARIGRMK